MPRDDESDAAKYISPKTLWNLRKIVTDNGLDGVLFEKITGKLVEAFKVDTSKQRLDSVHIKSNMRRLGRIGIFAGTIRKFLVNLKRQHRDLFDQLEPELVDKYLPKKGLGCFSFVKPSESAKKLSEVAVDLFELVRCFAGNDDVCGMSSYKLLVRVLEEQCEVTEASNGKPAEVSVKPAKPGKKGWYYLRYDDKTLRLARRRAKEQSPEFKDRYRHRAGVEATMSELDRRTGIKQMQVRRLPAVRASARLKAVGLNIFRAACTRRAKSGLKIGV